MLKLLHFLASLTPSLRRATPGAAGRVAVAREVQDLIEYEQTASDSDLWSRFRHDLAAWANSGVVEHGTIERLYTASMSLDPCWDIAPSQRALGRQVLRARLEDLYHALIDDAARAGARARRARR